MKTLQTLFRLYQLFVRRLPVVTEMAEWTNGDAKILSNFLDGTATGRKLRALRYNRIYESQIQAIKDASESGYSKGVAWGIRGSAAYEDSLLILSPTESESQESTDEARGQFQSVNR